MKGEERCQNVGSLFKLVLYNALEYVKKKENNTKEKRLRRNNQMLPVLLDKWKAMKTPAQQC